MKRYRFKPKQKIHRNDLLSKIEAQTGKKLHKDDPAEPEPLGYVSWWSNPDTGEVLEVEVGYRDDVIEAPNEAEI